ncbi:hypothetical protein QQF64_021254 [Cirrhinus molitorella]|uniref:Uncharacterized protein n=1 Tax=Cirrhinus molitorella TaxID=172907 RepID=A0ABR3LBF3_9TELE
MKTNPPIHPSPTKPCSPQRTVDINIVSFLFCQGQFSLPLKSTPSRVERKYSEACLNRTPDHDNNMDRCKMGLCTISRKQNTSVPAGSFACPPTINSPQR